MDNPNEQALREIADQLVCRLTYVGMPNEWHLRIALAALREAVLLERKACAEIARTFKRINHNCGCDDCREQAAAAIEKRGSQ